VQNQLPTPLNRAAPAQPCLPSLVIAAAALWLGAALFPFVTIDVVNDYIPWFNHIVSKGPVRAFSAPFGAYTPPYLYLLALMVPLKGGIVDAAIIKLAGLIANLLLAASVWHVLRRQSVAGPAIGAIWVLALPTVIANAALMGQCDALYAAPIVLAVGAALERRPQAMLGWYGLALAIKLQAILFAPFPLALLIAWRVAPWRWLAAPAAFAAAMVPAALAGWPIHDLATIYVRQSGDFAEIFLNAPNIWSVLSLAGVALPPLFGLALATATGASAAYLARIGATARHFSHEQLLRAALLAPLVTAGLLPRMHERYFFVADVLALLLFAVTRAPRDGRLVALTQLGSGAALFAYISGAPVFAALGAVPMIFAVLFLVQDLFAKAANDNPLMARPA